MSPRRDTVSAVCGASDRGGTLPRRENNAPGARAEADLGGVFPVRFSYKIKGGGRQRPPPAHKAPQCGAFPGFDQVVAKERITENGWS